MTFQYMILIHCLRIEIFNNFKSQTILYELEKNDVTVFISAEAKRGFNSVNNSNIS